MTQAERLANFQRNDPDLYARYVELPPWTPEMVVRCPVRNLDGTAIADDDVKGCGSDNVAYDHEVYDCLDCGIFFADFAADPPHRRDQETQP